LEHIRCAIAIFPFLERCELTRMVL